jgi:hypothetical protein
VVFGRGAALGTILAWDGQVGAGGFAGALFLGFCTLGSGVMIFL